MSHNILDAGGILPEDATLETELPLDRVAARSWSHPALPHPVVRVDLDALMPARDLEMEVLGFTDPEPLGTVGKQTRRPVGFPGAAILADPANARYALDVLKQFRKAARRARSKPGAAMEAFRAIGDTLGRSVPHFLPSFYEQASRVLLEVGNIKFAGQLFERAREAERVHALTIDESVRENTFVEFALAGALSIKSLVGYAKELAKGDPADAYATYRRVCVKRLLGGLPPFAAMAKELKRLAKAAGLDLKAEEDALIAEVIDAPSLKQAPKGFFKDYRRAILARCKADDSAMDSLVDLFPVDLDTSAWLQLLEDAGGIEHLFARDPKGLKTWLELLSGHATRGWRSAGLEGSWLSLFDRAGPILAALGETVQLQDRSVDLDMVDLLLSHGVSVDPHHPRGHIRQLQNVAKWVTRIDQPHRGRPLTHLMATADYAERLVQSTLEAALDPDAADAILARAGTRDALDQALGLVLAPLVDGTQGLPWLSSSLDKLPRSARVWSEFPHHMATLQTVDAAEALRCTLQIGIIDELGWPAFEAAIDRGLTTQTGTFPHPILCSKDTAIVFGPEGIVAEIDLQLPPDTEQVDGARWVQGQLLVSYRNARYARAVVWSSNWQEPFDGWLAGVDHAPARTDGALVFANGVLSAGDKTLPSGSVLCDGTTFWSRGRGGDNTVLHEIDPATGRVGRPSKPSFIEGALEDGFNLNVHSCTLYPMPNGLDSPLGGTEGLYGSVALSREGAGEPAWIFKHIDGHRLEGSREQPVPTMLLALPGHTTPRTLTQGSWRAPEALRDVHGHIGSLLRGEYHHGWQQLPDNLAKHYLTPRDPAGSETLRAVDLATTTALLKAALAAPKGDFAFEGTPLETAVRASLPTVQHAKLLRGIAGIAVVAAQLHRALDAMRTEAESSTTRRTTDPPALAAAVTGIADTGGFNVSVFSGLHAIDDGFRAVEDGQSIPVEHDLLAWQSLHRHPGALAFRAVHGLTPPDQRAALLELLEAMSSTVFTEHSAQLRVYTTSKDDWTHHSEVSRRGDNRWLVSQRWRQCYVVEWAASGTFVPADASTMLTEHRAPAPWGSADQVQALREAAPVDLVPHIEHIAQRTGLSIHAAAFLASGMRLHDDVHVAMGVKKTAYHKAAQGLELSSFEAAEMLHTALATAPVSFDAAVLAERLCEAWIAKRGVVLSIPEDLAKRVGTALRDRTPDVSVRSLLSLPSWKAEPWHLSPTNEQYLYTKGDVDHTTVDSLALASWLAHHVPVGDPLRQRIPEAIAAMKQQLSRDDLRFVIASVWGDDAVSQVHDKIGGTPILDPSGAPIEHSMQRDGVYGLKGQWQMVVYARPALAHIAPERLLTFGQQPWIARVRSLLAGEWDALAQRITDTPVPEGAYEVNPLHSAPGTVAAIAAHHGLDEHAATYYLQLLTLASAKDTDIRTWNGWTPRVFKAARSALIEAGLVLEAKRARAGRTVFLPGGWEALKDHLPIESWKMPLYDLAHTETIALTGPWSHFVTPEPIHVLYARAWQRVLDGDAPRYEEPGA